MSVTGMSRPVCLKNIRILAASLILIGFLTACPNNVKGMIVYSGVGEDGHGTFLYAVSPDGKLKTKLTDGENFVSYPAVSPDGRTVVFSATETDSKLRLYAIDGSGGKPRKLAETEHDAMLASWSPDGKRIAFLDRDPDYTTCIYIVNPDGTGLVKIVKDARHGNYFQYPPQWSKDGKRILYDRIDMQVEGPYKPTCLYIVNTDGSGEMPFGGHGQDRYHGAWSPDNDKVAYYTERTEWNYNRNDNAGIFIMNSDGTGETFLAPGFRPVWSPDGSLIAYTGSSPGASPIFIMYPDGTGPGTTTEEEGSFENDDVDSDPIPLQISFDVSFGIADPVWSPDGTMIAFVTATTEIATSKLYVAFIDGRPPLLLDENVDGGSRPDWK